MTVDKDKAVKTNLTQKLALLYAASIPFDGLSLAGRSLPFVVSSIYLIAAIGTRVLGTKARESGSPGLRGLQLSLVFTFYCGVTYYWSLAPDVTIQRFFTLVLLVLTAWLLARDLIQVKNYLPTAYVLGSIPASYIVLTAPTINSYTDRRTANGNANDVAFVLMLGVICALWLALNGTGWSRALSIPAVAFLISAVVATGSRTAIVSGGAAILAVIFWLVWRRKLRPLLIVLSLLGLGTWIYSLLPAGLIPQRLLHIQDSVAIDGLSDRADIWRAILARGFDLWGVGASAGPAYLHGVIGSASASHNVFLELLLETGIVGFLLFLCLLLSTAIASASSAYNELLFFLFPIVLASSLSLSLEATRPFWFVIALAWAGEARVSKTSESTVMEKTQAPSKYIRNSVIR